MIEVSHDSSHPIGCIEIPPEHIAIKSFEGILPRAGNALHSALWKQEDLAGDSHKDNIDKWQLK